MNFNFFSVASLLEPILSTAIYVPPAIAAAMTNCTSFFFVSLFGRLVPLALAHGARRDRCRNESSGLCGQKSKNSVRVQIPEAPQKTKSTKNISFHGVSIFAFGLSAKLMPKALELLFCFLTTF
jgi:hypothetical protein